MLFRSKPHTVPGPVGRYSHTCAVPHGAILDELGVPPDTIAELLTFLVGVDSLPGSRTARDEVFDNWFPDGRTPAHSLAVVTAPAQPEHPVEMEAVVAVPAR